MRIFFFSLLIITGMMPASAQIRTATTSAPLTVNSNVLSKPTADSVISDINQMFDQMEQQIELEFAKLKQEAKSNIEALNQKIKEIEGQIQQLKEQAKKIEKMAEAIDLIMPRFIHLLDSLNKTRSRPEIKQKAQQSLDSLKQVRAGRIEQLKKIDDEIKKRLDQKKELQDEIKQLESQLMKLEKEKQAILNSLQKQKQVALKEAVKNREQSRKQYADGLQTIRIRNSNILQDSLLHIKNRVRTVGSRQ